MCHSRVNQLILFENQIPTPDHEGKVDVAKYVSSALLLPNGPDAIPMRNTSAAIDSIHRDGTLPSIRTHVAPLKSGAHGYYRPTSHEVVLAESAAAPHLTFAHEIGHLLDHHGLGNGTTFASVSSPLLACWRRSIRATDAFRALLDLRNRYRGTVFEAHMEYLLSSEELWARSYAQFIASASDNEFLISELKRSRVTKGLVYIPRQWDDNDFAPVADSISALFRDLGWMP